MNDSRNNLTETWPHWGTKAAQKGPFMKIAYIVGLGRSGSTLLDLMLNAHSQVCTVGEAKDLWSKAHVLKRIRQKPRGYFTHGSRCTCQAETIWKCPFWISVNQHLHQHSGLSLTDLDIESNDFDRFHRDNLLFFQAVSKAGNVQVVVDSSKGLRRMKKLMKIPEIDVVPIHIVRNAQGRANSVRKNRFKIYTPSIHYSYNAFRLFFHLLPLKHAMVRYEYLVTHPQNQLSHVMNYLDLHFERNQLYWAEYEAHNLSGNSMNRNNDSTLKLDDSWKYELTPFQKQMIQILSAPGNAINWLKEKSVSKTKEQ